MGWISLFLIFTTVMAAPLPEFLTKHSPDTIRFINNDGRYSYIQKRPGVLGLVSSFRSFDFLLEPQSNDFTVRGSRYRTRLAIESIPNPHKVLNLQKNHKIYTVDLGNSVTREVGNGRNAKLHLLDEWISYYDFSNRSVEIQNLLTQKKYSIKLSKKDNPFFIPEVEMLSAGNVLYTDINQDGYAALILYDLSQGKSTVIYRSNQNATRLEVCSHEGHISFGEFSYDGVSRGSSIYTIKNPAPVNLTGFSSIYSSSDQDIGNMICLADAIFFIKTMGHNKEINHKDTEVVRLSLKDKSLQVRTDLKNVTQIFEMDGKILLPHRGKFYLLDGPNNLGEDVLQSAPKNKELELDI